MEAYYNYSGIKIYHGHALEVLKSMGAESAQMCVTSPPYWGLRDYNLPPMIWDGDESCEHVWGNHQIGRVTGGGDRPPDNKWKNVALDGNYDSKSIRSFCLKCGAWRGSLGLEPTPELYVNHLVQIFNEIRRVLRKDGVLWLNLGDSYAGSGSPGGDFRDGKGGDKYLRPYNRKGNGLKSKDLCGIPWRVAFALQADGWYLRSDIIWHKPNPMPESVTDRPTKAHEYIFLLTKSQKYYYNADAIKEDGPTYFRKASGYKGFENTHIGNNQKMGFADKDTTTTGRNKRSVWTVATKPYKAAHFAVFPPELPRTCILAGSRTGDIILDPFGGAMTTLMVAQQLNRKAIGIELSEDYIKIGINRLSQSYFAFG